MKEKTGNIGKDFPSNYENSGINTCQILKKKGFLQ